MNRFTSNPPRTLVSTERTIKQQKVTSPVEISHSEALLPDSDQSFSHSEAIENLEQQESEVRSTPKQQLNPPKMPESNESSQQKKSLSSGSEPVPTRGKNGAQALEDSRSPKQIYYSRSRMRLPPPVD